MSRTALAPARISSCSTQRPIHGAAPEPRKRPMARRSTYQRNLRPNCVWRGEFAWLVMIPNELEVTVVFGPPNRGVLKAFRNSALNWMRTRSSGLKSLNIDRSKLRIPSLRMSETLGDRLPNVKGAGWLKTVLSKYAFNRWSTGPSSLPLVPLLLARIASVKMPVVLVAEIAIGVPVWKVVIPLNCQPPSSQFTAGGAFLPK